MRENFLKLSDGTLMFDGDCLPYLIKQATGIEFKKHYSTQVYVLYSSTDADIWLNIESAKTSVEFKGQFFLRNDADQILKTIFEIFKSNEWAFHSTRTDFGYTIKLEDGETPTTLRRMMDFQKLKIITIGEGNNFLYKKAFNSNVSIVIYDKSNHLKEKASELYQELFFGKYKETDRLIRLEFRTHNKRTNLSISKSLKTYTQDEIGSHVWLEVGKRIKMKRKLQKFLKLKK